MALCGVLAASAGLSAQTEPTEAPPPLKLRVMTYNILVSLPRPGFETWTKRREGVLASIQRYQADLIGLQEPIAKQIAWLSERLAEYQFVIPQDYPDAAILVRKDRFEVVESGHFWLSPTPDQPRSRGWGNILPRLAQWAVVRERMRGTELALVNTHFDATLPFQPTAAPFFVAKVRDIAAGRPVIVTGDFNSAPGSEAYERLVSPDREVLALTDAFVGAGEVRVEDFEGLRDGYGFAIRVDHVFTGGAEFRTRRWIADVRAPQGVRPSDHEPIIADLELAVRSLSQVQPAAFPAIPALKLRVMTYNILVSLPAPGYEPWIKRKAAVVASIRSYNPDLIGLQEPIPGQIRDLQEALPHYALVRNDRNPDSCVLYRSERFEALESRGFWLSPTPETPMSRGFGNFLPRLVICVKFRDKPSGREFWLANTHFDNTSPSQVKSAPLFLERLQPLAAELPLIVTGDFNSRPGSEAYRTLTEGSERAPDFVLENAYDRAEKATVDRDEKPSGRNDEYFNEENEYRFEGRIDHIFTAGCEIEVPRWFVDLRTYHGVLPSDHYAITADLVIGAPRGAAADEQTPKAPPSPAGEEEF